MPNRLAHFAIEADDVTRAAQFYETVFGWTFEPWGPPEFYLIQGAGLHGALQKRREPLPEGRKGYECTFAVDNLDATIALIREAGGSASGQSYTIPGVGTLTGFLDSEGNQALIMQYEASQLAAMGLAS